MANAETKMMFTRMVHDLEILIENEVKQLNFYKKLGHQNGMVSKCETRISTWEGVIRIINTYGVV